MADYLQEFDRIRHQVGPLLENLGPYINMQAGKSEDLDSECEKFVATVLAAERSFKLLTPPPLCKNIHRLLEKFLRGHVAVAKLIKNYLKTGDLRQLTFIGDELPALWKSGDNLYAEIQRLNRRYGGGA